MSQTFYSSLKERCQWLNFILRKSQDESFLYLYCSCVRDNLELVLELIAASGGTVLQFLIHPPCSTHLGPLEGTGSA